MGFLDRIFRGKTNSNIKFDLSTLKIDMHSHLIPGIDDGAKSMDDTIAMLAKFERLGYDKVITTPHIMSDFYKNTPEIITNGLLKVREEIKRHNLKIEIEAAAEYYFDDSLLMKLISDERLMTFGDNYVLFEFSMHSKPDQIDQLLFEMLARNYKPVLAHYERYSFLFGDIDSAKKWRDQGVYIQMNLNSLTGHYGPEVKNQAEKLIDNKLVDFVGTDCHRMDHLMLLEKNLNLKYFQELSELDLKNSSL